MDQKQRVSPKYLLKLLVVMLVFLLIVNVLLKQKTKTAALSIAAITFKGFLGFPLQSKNGLIWIPEIDIFPPHLEEEEKYRKPTVADIQDFQVNTNIVVYVVVCSRDEVQQARQEVEETREYPFQDMIEYMRRPQHAEPLPPRHMIVPSGQRHHNPTELPPQSPRFLLAGNNINLNVHVQYHRIATATWLFVILLLLVARLRPPTGGN